MYKFIKYIFLLGNFIIDIIFYLLFFLGRVIGDIERVIFV